jgi:hypothetical protein
MCLKPPDAIKIKTCYFVAADLLFETDRAGARRISFCSSLANVYDATASGSNWELTCEGRVEPVAANSIFAINVSLSPLPLF